MVERIYIPKFVAVATTLALTFAVFGLAKADPLPTVTLSPIGNQTAAVGETVTFAASAIDSDASSTIAFNLSGAPAGASIDPTSGAFSWTTVGFDPGDYSFSVNAVGSTGGSDSKGVTITLAQAQTATSTNGTGGVATTTGGTVITGDATATTTVDNSLNTNNTSPDTFGTMNSSTTTVANTNDGTLESSATTTADTGDNTVVGGQGDNTVITGNAVSTSNVINEVNTNIFNSDGLILFLNQLFGGGFDLNDYDLSYFFVGGPGASPYALKSNGQPRCTLLTCLNSSTLNVFNQNTATVTNSVIVRSSTGSNTASSTGAATIDTGDAYAAANVVNLVNTNIVNSSYLLLSFNNFGDLWDNITLPGANFFSRLFASGVASSSVNASTITVNNNNDVSLIGTTTATATTGDNLASTTIEFATTTDPTSPNYVSSTTPTGTALVTTGNAYASSNSYNQVNTNNVGGTSVFFLFRIAGAFTGSVVGLPQGLTETIIPDGGDTLVALMSDNATTSPQALQLLEHYNASHFNAISTSTAAIENNIDVSADTGHNTATSDLGTSTVATGNAYASANVFNLVNTNIVGQNWILGVFNLFGNFGGDIVFGEGSPTLALVANSTPQSVGPGGVVTYTFTVDNTGTGDARNAVLNTSFDNTLISFDPPAGVTGTETATGHSWQLGNIPRGQSRTYTFTGHVGGNFPAGQTATVPLTAAVVNDNITAPATSNTTNADITVTAPGNSGGGGGGGGGGGPIGTPGTDSTPEPILTITKSSDAASTTPGSTVNYQVVVDNPNNGTQVYQAYLTDTLTDPNGNVMYTRSWGLDTVAPGDQITLTYSVEFSTTSVSGLYHNVATVTGYKTNPNSLFGGLQIKPISGTHDIEMVGGLVLGTSTVKVGTSSVSSASTDTGAACAPLIGRYLRSGLRGTDVLKLQAFLNNTQGTKLPTTGTYGPMTTAAVAAFQKKFGISQVGTVGPLTMAKVNSISCGGVLPAAAAAALPTVPIPTTPKAPVKKTSTAPKQVTVTTPAPTAPTPDPAPAPEPQKRGWFSGFIGLFH